MDMSAATFWWIAAGVPVAVELATGTFYLLMLALGLAAARAGGPSRPGQRAADRRRGAGRRRRHGAVAPEARASRVRSRRRSENRDVNIDIGEQVQVDAWAADGTARVTTAARTWTARLAPGAAPGPGVHRVSRASKATAWCWHRSNRTERASTARQSHYAESTEHAMEIALDPCRHRASSSSSARSRSCRSRTPGSSSAWASTTAR